MKRYAGRLPLTATWTTLFVALVAGLLLGAAPAWAFVHTHAGNPTAHQRLVVSSPGAEHSLVPASPFGGRFLTMAGPLAKITFSVAKPVEAGVPFTVTATARDANGNKLTTYNGSATWSDLSGSISPATPSDFVNGISQTSATVPNPFHHDRISMTTGGVSGQSDFFDVFGPMTQIAVSVGPQPITAGNSFIVRAVARDALGSRVHSYNATATWSDLSGSLSPPAPANFVNGLSLTTASVSVPFDRDRITVTSGIVSGSSGFFDVRGPLDHLSIEMPAGPFSTGETFTVIAKARDAANNVLVGYNGSATWSDLSGALSPAAPNDFASGVSTTTGASVGTAFAQDTITVVSGGVQGTSTPFDVNAAPTGINLTNNALNENQPAATTVGALSAVDVDAGQTHTFSLPSTCGGTSFPNNTKFQLSGANLQSAQTFNFEAKGDYTICVRVTDSGTPARSFEKKFTISITDINDAPVAVNDGPYGGVIGNTKAQLGTSSSAPVVTLSGSLPLANDSDEDATFPHTLSAVAETNTSTGGGSATINSDGSFTFLPGVGDKNQNDTFTYHVTDGSATSTGTVTVTIDNSLVWYVDNASAASTHDGRSSSPFLNLGSLNAAGGAGDSDGTGDHIFLYQGSGSYGGGIPLEANQKLYGQKHGLTVNGINLVSAGVTAPVITNGAGTGVGLASGVDVQGLNISGTSGDALNGSAVTTATVGTTTAVNISSAGGDGVDLSGAASGDISIASPITGSAGHSVSVANRSGGTVALSGAISDNGTGISLSSNTGATINLTGGVTASTGTNTAFGATGGGTVNVTGANNTLATTTGTALNVQNTTIGASGLTFKSISAGTGSGSAGDGIILDTTGSTAGLTVTGNGSAGTGGTIQHKTGADGSTTSGIGIYLNSTAHVSLAWMQLNDFDNMGIYGTSVNGFSLSNSTIGGTIGTSTGSQDAPLVFGKSNPSGTNGLNGANANSVTDTEITGGIEHNFELYNQSGSFSLNVTRANVHDNSVAGGSDGILMEMQGTASGTIVVDDSDFTNLKSQGIQVAANDSSSANVTINNSSFVRGTQGNEGIVLSNGSNGDLTTHVTSNTISGYGGVGIFVGQTPGNATSSSFLTATIQGNTVTSPTTATNHSIIAFLTSTSGSTAQSHATLLIDGNTVNQNSTGGTSRGILVDTPDSNTAPDFDATVTNNTVHIGDPVNGVLGLAVNARHGVAGQGSTACFNVKSNLVDGEPAGVNGVRVRQAATAGEGTPVVSLERGAAPLASPPSTVLATNNPASSTEVLGTVGVVENGTCATVP